jgi:hypothetical protein
MQPEITQRDLRNKSKEIMDAVENDHLLTLVPVTRPDVPRQR